MKQIPALHFLYYLHNNCLKQTHTATTWANMGTTGVSSLFA